jgi:hypothetical protein
MPHRVLLGDDRFYGRTSAGKYPLDVGELRMAFLVSETLGERIRGFRGTRLAAIQAGETPVTLPRGAKVILHVLPVTLFDPESRLDLATHLPRLRALEPLGSRGWSHRINLDGIVTYTGESGVPVDAYVQVFRAGAIEAVLTFPREVREPPFIQGQPSRPPFIPSLAYEEYLVAGLAAYMTALAQVGVGFPLFVFLSVVQALGYHFAIRDDFGRSRPAELDRDTLILPEVVAESSSADAGQILRPLFDMVWNAFGMLRSPNYDANGRFRPQR